MKIWQKNPFEHNDISLKTEAFTVGNDRILDMRLAPFDVAASLAHAKMLQDVGILTAQECLDIEKGLKHILNKINAGQFEIEEHIEDIHSQIEKELIEEIGEAGKKIHTGRSRNDQVLVAIKLYLKSEIKEIAGLSFSLFERLQELSEQNKAHLMPGYTHFQLAMPSSFGLWFGAYAESLVDDMEVLSGAYIIANKNPLGSGAGYGSAFPLNRTLTTELLEMKSMNYNSLYAQMTRGKTEKVLLSAIANLAATLSKFAYDVCLYLNQQFAYLTFPDSLTTGSSIMPHKKNPDVFELIRAKCNRLQAAPNEMTLLINNLPSGYHRDMQLSKDIVFPAIDTMKDCLQMLTFALQNVNVRTDILNDEQFNTLFTVEEINKLVKDGMSFRDAYRKTGMEVNENKFSPNKTLNHTHEGSIGNLCNTEIREMMLEALKKFG
ncbi:MAG: argininosuccinate lyase [Bacteroidia bacterium]|nr:argininosuccinate lyase [Bacteroidia bacterium]MCO5254295.1 argininosuccinate lyase [Bacteroidota bacterium]